MKKKQPTKQFNKKPFTAIIATVIILVCVFLLIKSIAGENKPVDIKQVLSSDKVDSIITKNTITLSNNQISPSLLTIDTKESVSWINGDSVSHTVLFSDNVTKTIATHQAFSRTFSQTGEITYTVKEFPGQLGQIRVTSADHTAPARGG